MLACYTWWGRLKLSTRAKGIPKHRSSQDDGGVSLPPYLFESDWVADDDVEFTGDDDLVKLGEHLRGEMKARKKQKQLEKELKQQQKEEEQKKNAKAIDATVETISDAPITDNSSENDKARPKMVWLMSYPNSGTSYTMMMVGRASSRATASNYGREVADDGVVNTPLYPGHWEGPYYKPDERRPLPEDYILVKTHCGGRCITCGPEKYVLDETEFLDECRRGSGFFPARHRQVEEGTSIDYPHHHDSDDETGYHTVHYDYDLVKKAIHLYRNPFHNIVSRFHLERKHWVDSKKEYEAARYPNNSTGFQRWCKDLNKFYGPAPNSKQKILPKNIVKLMQDVPCHGEMYKYIQWHNMAYAVTNKAKKPTMILHYENYESKWNDTATKIFDFLHLDMVGEKRPFSARHDYRPYFTSAQRNATKALIQELASEPVWTQVERYFSR